MDVFAQCAQKLKLLYFDVQFIDFACRSVTLLKPVHPVTIDIAAMTSSLGLIKQHYMRINAQLEDPQQSPTPGRLSEFHQILAKDLARTYQSRRWLWDGLVTMVEQSRRLVTHRTVLVPLLYDIDQALDRIILFLNRDGELPNEAMRTDFEQQLNTTRATVQRLAQMALLQTRLGDYYAVAYQQQAKIAMLKAWQAELTRALDTFKDQPADISLVLAVKALLAETKLRFYLRFYQALPSCEAALIAQLAALVGAELGDQPLETLDVNAIKARLTEQLRAERAAVATLEQRCQAYTTTQSITGNGLRLWMQSYYYSLSQALFTFVEDATAAGVFAQWPILSTPLSPRYFQLFLALASVTWCKVDHWLYGGVTVAFTLLRSVSQQLTNHYLLPVCEHMGFNEASALSHLPSIQWLLGLFLHVTTFSVLTGGDRYAVGLLTTCYSSATLLQALSALLSNALEAHLFDKTDRLGAQARQLLLKHWLQQYSYRLGYDMGSAGYQSAVTFFTPLPDRDSVLADKQVCQRHAEHCEAVALEVLDLPSPATSTQIKAAWRDAMRKRHPDVYHDISDDAHAETIRANNARDRLLQLMRK